MPAPGYDTTAIISALWSELHGQPIADWINDRRDAGHSLQAIADEIATMTDGAITVSRGTIFNWSGGKRDEVAA